MRMRRNDGGDDDVFDDFDDDDDDDFGSENVLLEEQSLKSFDEIVFCVLKKGLLEGGLLLPPSRRFFA